MITPEYYYVCKCFAESRKKKSFIFNIVSRGIREEYLLSNIKLIENLTNKEISEVEIILKESGYLLNCSLDYLNVEESNKNKWHIKRIKECNNNENFFYKKKKIKENIDLKDLIHNDVNLKDLEQYEKAKLLKIENFYDLKLLNKLMTYKKKEILKAVFEKNPNSNYEDILNIMLYNIKNHLNEEQLHELYDNWINLIIFVFNKETIKEIAMNLNNFEEKDLSDDLRNNYTLSAIPIHRMRSSYSEIIENKKMFKKLLGSSLEKYLLDGILKKEETKPSHQTRKRI